MAAGKVNPMKLHIDIDTTPEEARTFLGLPDVAPIQERVLKEMEARMMEAMKSDPQSLLKAWTVFGGDQFEQFQRFMWDAASKAASGGKSGKP
jgi:hypothetical protein